VSQQPVYVFDAYGTLFDVAAAARRVLAGHPGDARLLAEIWRGRQLEYAWTDTALGQPTNFWDATTRALNTALIVAGLDGDAGLRDALLAAYAELDAYEDALPAIRRIAAQGGRSVVYSNADGDMLRKSVAAAGLDEALDDAISVDGIGVYKPHPDAYAYMRALLGIDAPAAYFVSSNPWDAAGAAKAGFNGIWINRQRHPYPFPAVPVYREAASLTELPV
jgi:2-haloacid dehalogenase